MIKKINDVLAGLPATIIGGVFLLASFILPRVGVDLPIDPAWASVFICGLPLLYLAVWRIIYNPGISKISSALLISIAMIAAVIIGDLFAAGEVAFIIFSLCAQGNGPGKIARTLTERHIPTPGTIRFQRTGQTAQYHPDYPTFWESSTIANILEHKEYLGHTVNFKTTKASFKSKKTIENPEDKQVVFENTHEAIIDQATWEAAQKVRQQRRRPTKMGDMGLFSGLLYCADCGHTLHLNRTKSWSREQDNYTCGTYKQKKGLCTAHYIRVTVLEALVLENIQKVIALSHVDEAALLRQLAEERTAEQEKLQVKAKRQLEKQERRMAEIDGIIKRLYEDNLNDKLTDERFAKLSVDYEREQTELRNSTAGLQREVEQTQQREDNTKQFLKLVKSYTVPDKLTPAILHALVDKIIVHAPDKSSGHRTQQIDIYYNFVGQFDLSHETATRQTAKETA